MRWPWVQRGFTLVEVLITAFMLAVLATGAIAVTWRLAGFARLKASTLAAESFCSDVAMAYVSQDLSGLAKQTEPVFKKTFKPEEKKSITYFPRYRGKDFLGHEIDEIPFWRDGYKNPTLTVWVTNTAAGVAGMRAVHVILDWGVEDDPNFTPATFTMEQGENLE